MRTQRIIQSPKRPSPISLSVSPLHANIGRKGTKGLLIRMFYICPMISQKFYLRHTLNPKILMEQDALYQQLLLAI